MSNQLTISPVFFGVCGDSAGSRSPGCAATPRAAAVDPTPGSRLIDAGSTTTATARALATPGETTPRGPRTSWFRDGRVALGMAPGASRGPAGNLRVLSLNIQVDAQGGRLPGIVAMIRESNADIVGLQECGAETGREIARQLGYHVVQSGDDTPVLSRYPLEAPGAGQRAVTVRLPNDQRVLFMNLHLGHAPYQPFQLLGIPYADGRFISTEAEAISEARAARGAEVDRAVAELATRDRKVPSIIVCDCNQPSHHDWTAEAVAAGLQPLPVRWPESLAFTNAGFVDAYRRVFPNPVSHPGFTWTPLKAPTDPTDHADRLDFVYSDALEPRSARILGESRDTSNMVFTPYPTDHRGVLVDYDLPRAASLRRRVFLRRGSGSARSSECCAPSRPD